MTRGDFPWHDITPSEVRVLALQGFNAHEIATVAGVPDDVGEFLRCKALGRKPAWTLRDDVCLPDGSVPAIDRSPMPFWTNHSEAA